MRRLYGGLSYGIIALGVVHILAASRIYAALTPAALWFVSGGLTLILTGVLNLLNRAYGQVAPGLRRGCFATNLVMTGFTLLSGIVGHASPVTLVVVVGLFAGTTVLGLTPRALPAGERATE